MKISRKFLVGGAAASVLVVSIIGVALWPWSLGNSPGLVADDTAVVARGATIYAMHCASCHGKKLEGQPNWKTRLPNGRMPAPPHDANGHTWHHADEILFKLTKLGTAAVVGGNYKSDMPGYAGTLADDEIVAVLSYIKSTWPPSIRQRHDSINQRKQ